MSFELFSHYLMGKGMTRWHQILPRQKKRLIQDRIDAFKLACYREAGKYDGQIWGNKITTEHIFGLQDHNLLNPKAELDIIDVFFRSLDELKMIFILRDGRTCVMSKVRRTEQTIDQACTRWKFSVKIYQYLKNRHPRSLAIKYEDLLKEPENVLTTACTFLGVPFDPSMMSGTNNPILPVQYRNQEILKAKLSDPIEPASWHSLIADELQSCGYQ